MFPSRRYPRSVAFGMIPDVMPHRGRLRNRDREKVLSAPINLDFLRQGEFRSRKGFSQLCASARLQ